LALVGIEHASVDALGFSGTGVGAYVEALLGAVSSQWEEEEEEG
jgi:hypothetical protein